MQFIKNDFRSFKNDWRQRYVPIIVQDMLVTLFEECHNFSTFKMIGKYPSTEGMVDDMN